MRGGNRVILVRLCLVVCLLTALAAGMGPRDQGQAARLRQLSLELGQRSQHDRLEAVALAQAGGYPIIQSLPGGRLMELQKFIGQRPVYYITANLSAAGSVSTDHLWPEGSLGLGLTGSGLILGIWDSGLVLATHRELAGRVTPMDTAASGNHGTHVAGTMIASGEAPQAHGMAHQAEMWSYDWDDDLAEVAEVAAGDMVSLSNHSYGFVAGWQPDYSGETWAWFGDPAIDSTEDWLFGFYLQESADWDRIAHEAPTYLIVASAGNDRWDDGPEAEEQYYVFDDDIPVLSNSPRQPDGDFDSLPGGLGVAKNVLVVGAVDDLAAGYDGAASVIMTGFSSWGPTDDGRIKPDLVANGVGLYSSLASGDWDYGSFSGTSQAAAVVSGSVALLQQYYQETHSGELPRAATLRALVIHTADEAGDWQGPDYAYGWGLLNTVRAAETISADALDGRTIQELVLYDSQTCEATVMATANDTLKVTIAWTDPPGPVLAPALDPSTPMLVNDLDLRVTGNGLEYAPWILDKDYPHREVSKGDNQVDNVEQVLIANPAPGPYTITVTHKGNLPAGAQAFSLIITGGSVAGLPRVLVWDGDSSGADYSGWFIRAALTDMGLAEVTYTADFPLDFDGYDAAFLSFGNAGAEGGQTYFTDNMATVVQTYMESGGSLYLEGGDALGKKDFFNQGANDTLHHLLGLTAVADGVASDGHVVGAIAGMASTVAEDLSFAGTNQNYTAYIDHYDVGAGSAALVEEGYGTVGVQYAGAHGQRTFVFSYALAGLADGTTPSTRHTLVSRLMEFFTDRPLPPVASDDSYVIPEDSTVVLWVLANDYDPDGDPLTISAVGLAVNGEASRGGGDTTIVYAPALNFFGSDSFVYVVSDSAGGQDTATVTLTVLPVNDAPVLTSAAGVVAVVDSPFTYTAMATDVEDDTVTFTFAGLPGWLPDIADGTVSGLPPAGAVDTSFVVIASDGQLANTLKVAVVVVCPEPVAPVAVNDTASTLEDQPVSLHVLANDALPADIARKIVGISQGTQGEVSIEAGDTTLAFMPDLDFFGADSFAYAMGDSLVGFDTAMVYVLVAPVNDPPPPFELLAPVSQSHIVITRDNLSDSLQLDWEIKPDVVDGDSLTYRLVCTGKLALVLGEDVSVETGVQWGYADLAETLGGLGLQTAAGGWNILASDGQATTVAGNGPFVLEVDIALLATVAASALPERYALSPNYPNPFNPVTTLPFALPEGAPVQIVVHDLRGRPVRTLVDEQLTAGYYRVSWDGRTDLGTASPSGLYFVRMRAGDFVGCIKLVLLR